MKKFIGVSFLFIGLLQSVANGAIVFSSLNSTGSFYIVTSTANDGRAMNFVMPSDFSYNLTSVELRLGGIADAGVEIPEITVWSNDTASPDTPIGTQLQTLTLSGTLAGGINTFTSAGLILEEGETYWIVIRNLGSDFNMVGGLAGPSTGTSTDGAYSDTATDVDPSTWDGNLAPVYLSMAVNAVAVPEPAAALLGALGLIGLLCRRR